jgi:hypothetical protein
MGNSNSKGIVQEQKQELGKQLLDEVNKREPDITKIKEFINYGANINYKDKDGNSPIIVASKMGDKDIVNLLLSKGANPNDIDKYYRSPILTASRNGHVNVVELLLSKGANINYKDNYGNTSLIWAIKTNNTKLFQLLLNNRASIPEDIDELLQDKPEIKLIWNKWHTMIMGLAVTKDLNLGLGAEMDLAEFVGTRDPSGGKKIKKSKKNKRNKKSNKNKRKSIKGKK